VRACMRARVRACVCVRARVCVCLTTASSGRSTNCSPTGARAVNSTRAVHDIAPSPPAPQVFMSAFSNASGVVLRNAQLCDEAAQQTNRRAPTAMRRRASAMRRRASAIRRRASAMRWRASAVRRCRLHASINSMVTMLQQTEPSGVRCAACRCGSGGGPVPLWQLWWASAVLRGLRQLWWASAVLRGLRLAQRVCARVGARIAV
jgi:hypothetical protein